MSEFLKLQFLAGYRTYIAAGIAAFVAFNEIAHIVSPEVQQTLLAVAIALGLYGVRQAIGSSGAAKPVAVFLLFFGAAVYADSIDIPRECRIPNRTGMQCAWSSLETCARYHKIERLYGLTQTYHGMLNDPTQFDRVLRRAKVQYRISYQGRPDLAWLKGSIQRGYPVVVGLNGQHAVTLCGLTDKRAEIIDNMDPHLRVWYWPINDFYRAWDGLACLVIPDHVEDK
jgi:hypothetical protein